LLRLPGELRNRIFYFAFQGIHIRVVAKTAVLKGHRVFANEDGSLVRDIASVFGLAQTSRQIYAEIGLLPFEHLTVHLDDASELPIVLPRVTDAQRSAISTISITRRYARSRGAHHVKFIQMLEDKLINAKTARSWSNTSWCFGKKSLPGLKHIVVEDWTEKDDGQGFLKFLYYCERNRDIEVVLGAQKKKWEGGTA